MKLRIKRNHIPLLILLLFGLFIFFIGIFNHYFFKTATYDYGNYNFAFWDYSHFRLTKIPLLGCNFLQDHFSLTLMYFVPVYWLLNWLTQTYTLIIIQCSMIVIAGWYSLRLIQLKTDSLWLRLGVVVYYFVLLGRYTSFSGDVNLAIISACFIPIFLFYFEIKKYVIAFIILVLSLFSRENIPLWFIFIFIVLIIQNYKDKKAVFFSVAGIVISFFYFILLFKVLIPAIETPERPYSLFNYSALGATPGEALSFIFHHPFDSVKLLFENHLGDKAYDGIKAEFYWVYLISGGILLLLRPQYFIWFIPIVAQKMLNDAPVRWGIFSYYSIEVVTLLPLSVFLSLSALKQMKLQAGLAIAACIAAASITIYKMDMHNNTASWMMNPPKEKFYDQRFFKPPFDIKKVNLLLSLIPCDAKVSSSNMFTPHLAQRQNIYFFPEVSDAEYIVFSVFDDHYSFPRYYNEKCRLKYLLSTEWEIIESEYPVFLLKRIPENITQNKDQLWSHSDTLFCNYEEVDSLNNILFSNGEVAEKKAIRTQAESLSSFNSIVLQQDNNNYSSAVSIKDIGSIRHLQIYVWCNKSLDNSYIIASNNKDLYKASNEYDSVNASGWKRLVLSFWIPEDIGTDSIMIALNSTNKSPVYFDDLQIVKNYK